jgi:cell division protein FtsI/penicillin-binding protein 2
MKKAAAIKLRPNRKPADLKKTLFTRFMLIVAVFILWIGGISVRLVHLQVNQHTLLLAKAQNQRLNIKKTKMMRGTIYDRNGAVLAMSVPIPSRSMTFLVLHAKSQKLRESMANRSSQN